MTTRQQIGFDFRLPATFRKRGRWYIGSCAPLDLHSQGRTREEARQNLGDAVVFFVESCVRRGTLGEALHELGCLGQMVEALDIIRPPGEE